MNRWTSTLAATLALAVPLTAGTGSTGGQAKGPTGVKNESVWDKGGSTVGAETRPAGRHGREVRFSDYSGVSDWEPASALRGGGVGLSQTGTTPGGSKYKVVKVANSNRYAVAIQTSSNGTLSWCDMTERKGLVGVLAPYAGALAFVSSPPVYVGTVPPMAEQITGTNSGYVEPVGFTPGEDVETVPVSMALTGAFWSDGRPITYLVEVGEDPGIAWTLLDGDADQWAPWTHGGP
jgi:hypothetical protein